MVVKNNVKGRVFYGLIISLISALVIFFAFAPGIVEKRLNQVVMAANPVTNPGNAIGDTVIREEVKNLHERLRIADLHADSLLWNRDLLERGSRGHVDVPRLLEGNVALQVFTTVTKSPDGLNNERNEAKTRDNITLLAVAQRWPIGAWQSLYARAVHQSDRLSTFIARSRKNITLIKNKADLSRLFEQREKGEKVVGALLGTEGSHALDGDIANVKKLFGHGFRMMSLHHFFDNRLGGSLHGVAKTGLTDFGREVVREIEKLEIMLDLSHSSPQVVEDVLAMTKRPIIVSHTGIKSHCANARNISDRLMKKIAAGGGLIGMGYWSSAACDISPSGLAKSIKAAIGVVGVDHVALGSDFDGAVTTAFDVSKLSKLTQALVDEGLSESAIEKVMGENQIRFFSEYLPE